MQYIQIRYAVYCTTQHISYQGKHNSQLNGYTPATQYNNPFVQQVRASEGQYDRWMQQSYLKQKGLDKVDVCFAFTEGD